MNFDRASTLRTLSAPMTVVVLISLLAGSVFASPATANSHSATVLRLESRSGESVRPEWREAVRSGLVVAAAAGGVILCTPGEDLPDCVPDVVQDAPRLAWSISTAIEIRNALAIVRVPLSLEVLTSNGVPVPKEGLFVIEEVFALTGEKPANGWDPWLAARAAGIVGNHPAVTKWFTDVGTTPGLQSQVSDPVSRSTAPSVPSAKGANAPQTPDSPASSTPPAMHGWEQQQERILQLLIDNRFGEARRAADHVLDDADLPPSERDRVLRLRQTALEREATTNHPAFEATKEEPPQPAQAPFDYTFKVRLGETGLGFLRGMDGRLRLFEQGVSFVPAAQSNDPAQSGAGWFLRWSQIRSWGEAQGLWDVSHPLEVRSTDGRNIYFAVIDRNGQFGSGDRVLSLLSKGAERARKR